MRSSFLTLTLAGALCLTGSTAQADGVQDHADAVEGEFVQLVERVSKAFVVIGGGSGIVVTPDGYVLTNHHVAGSRPIGEDWQVILPGQRFATAKMIGTDERGDISLLKLEGDGPWDYVEMADSDQVEVGEATVALGNPFGFSKDGTPHVSLGVVSSIHRLQGGYTDAIQTDTPINPGNSGGPLIDMDGKLLGINGKIAVRWGNRANSGVGYAIPTNQIKQFWSHFEEKGEVNHGAISGVRFDNTRQGGEGAVVRSINRESNAYEAGLRRGDLIVEADGRGVHSAQRLLGIAGTFPEGEQLPVKVLRDGSSLELTLLLESRGGSGQGGAGGFLGVRMSNHDDGGAEIEVVVPDSPAAESGLEAGDVVTGVSLGRREQAITNTNDLIQLLSRSRPGMTLTLKVKRGEAELELEVTLGQPPR